MVLNMVYLFFSFSTLQGVMAIPSLFLFHNGKAAARYNETEYKVDMFAGFITRYTGKLLDNLFPINCKTILNIHRYFSHWGHESNIGRLQRTSPYFSS